jgi:FecR protein
LINLIEANLRRVSEMLERFLVPFLVWTTVLVLSGAAQAAPVGRFVRLEGQVELLKQGKLPPVPVKMEDGVEPGDVIFTKAKAKAQMKFADESIITLAPESRVEVIDFSYDPAQGRRRVVMRLYKGLLHNQVPKMMQNRGPDDFDFSMETRTAHFGVRGDEWYTLVKPNSTLVFLLKSVLYLKTNNPNSLVLQENHKAEVWRDKVSEAEPLRPEVLAMLKEMMITGVPESAVFGGFPPDMSKVAGAIMPRP